MLADMDRQDQGNHFFRSDRAHQKTFTSLCNPILLLGHLSRTQINPV